MGSEPVYASEDASPSPPTAAEAVGVVGAGRVGPVAVDPLAEAALAAAEAGRVYLRPDPKDPLCAEKLGLADAWGDAALLSPDGADVGREEQIGRAHV